MNVAEEFTVKEVLAFQSGQGENGMAWQHAAVVGEAAGHLKECRSKRPGRRMASALNLDNMRYLTNSTNASARKRGLQQRRARERHFSRLSWLDAFYRAILS